MADNFQVKDAGGSTITMSSTEAGGVHTPKRVAAPAAAIVAPIAAKTVPTAAAEALGGSTACTRGCFIQSLHTNTAVVYIGGVGVTTANGIALQPGDCLWVPVDNIADVYCISATAAQVLRIMGV